MQIHALTLGLGRAYLLETEEGLFLIDAGSRGREQIVLRLMKKLGRQDLKLILLTHAHLDHYGSAAALRESTGAPIAIHSADAPAMAEGRTPLGKARGFGRWIQMAMPFIRFFLQPAPTTADFTVQEGDSLAAWGLEAVILHTPGHTIGSASVLLPSGEAFVGDLISTTGGAHIQRYFAQDWSQLMDSLVRLAQLAPNQVYAGHGLDAMPGHRFQTLVAAHVKQTSTAPPS